jgi:hypothetical protein
MNVTAPKLRKAFRKLAQDELSRGNDKCAVAYRDAAQLPAASLERLATVLTDVWNAPPAPVAPDENIGSIPS